MTGEVESLGVGVLIGNARILLESVTLAVLSAARDPSAATASPEDVVALIEGEVDEYVSAAKASLGIAGESHVATDTEIAELLSRRVYAELGVTLVFETIAVASAK